MGEAALAVVSSERLVISANAAYIEHVGRHRDAILGHDYLPWIDPRDRDLSAAGFARVAAKFEPSCWKTRVVRGGSILVLQQTTAMPFRVGNDKTVVFCSIRPLKILTATENDVAFGPKDVAEYVEDLTSGLARMADRVGLFDLGQTLERVAEHAAEVGAQVSGLRNDGNLH